MRVVALAALAGCGFSPTPLASSATFDAAPPIGSDAGMVAMPDALNPRPCYAPDMTGIVMCLELDDPDLVGSGIAHDGAPGRHDATVTDGDATTRSVPAASPAQTISTTTTAPQATLQTADSADFSVSAITLMVWVNPSSTPAGTNTYGLIEKSNDWLMALDGSGNLLCRFQDTEGGIDGPNTIAVPLNQWSLVACTYDGNMACAVVDVGGSGAGTQQCANIGLTLNGAMDHGVMIGARWSTIDGVYNHLYGSLDSARIFNRALSAAQICAGGGRTGC